MSDRKSLPLRIFLASPGDVAQQRTQVRDIVESVNADPDRVHSEFEVVGWEQVRGTVARPQDAINELIRESHYAIVLFREKWGSNPNSPQKFTSGTEEELFQALLERASQRGLMRDVWVAFISCENAEIPVRDLKASIQSEGSLLYETISDNDDLRVKLTQRLKSWGSVQTRTPHSAKLIPSSKIDVLGIADLVDQGKFLLSIGKLDGESLLAEAARLGGAEEKLEFSQALLRIGKKGEAEEQIDLAIREYRSHSLIHTSAGTLALVRKASILRANGKNVEAISLMQTAAPRAAATTASEKLVKARLLDEWGQGLKATKENERALAKFQEAMQIRDSLNEVEEMAQSRINIARMLVESKKFDEAARLAREAIGLVEELPLGDRLPNAYLALGQCQLRQGKIEDAITSGERCLALNRQISSKRGEVFAMNLLVQSYKSAGRFDEATRFANEALELNREMGDERGLQRISWQLADIKSKASSF